MFLFRQPKADTFSVSGQGIFLNYELTITNYDSLPPLT